MNFNNSNPRSDDRIPLTDDEFNEMKAKLEAIYNSPKTMFPYFDESKNTISLDQYRELEPFLFSHCNPYSWMQRDFEKAISRGVYKTD